jgi:hypothetical protein
MSSHDTMRLTRMTFCGGFILARRYFDSIGRPRAARPATHLTASARVTAFVSHPSSSLRGLVTQVHLYSRAPGAILTERRKENSCGTNRRASHSSNF